MPCSDGYNECGDGPCPVKTTVDLISGKWKSIILYHLLDGKKRFSELKRLTGDVSQRTFTMQLRELERDGLLHRTVYPEVPPRVEYELTPLGQSMEPILQAMREWGIHYKGLMAI